MSGSQDMLRMIILFKVVLWVPMVALSQGSDQLKDQTEEILHLNEHSRIPEEALEQCQEMMDHPLNLNTATSEELEASGLFTSFQTQMIIAYRELHGELLSIYELASITGLSISRLKEVSPYVSVSNRTEGIRRHPGKSRIIMYSGKVMPDAIGHGSQQPGGVATAYAGSPIKTSLRLKMTLGRSTELGMAYEKDAGERFFRSNRPEYLTGYWKCMGSGILEQAVIGSFRLQGGLGLVQGGSPFNTLRGNDSRPLMLSSLRPYAGLSESNTHNGVGIRLDIRPLKVILWSSYQSMDLSLGNLVPATDKTDWVAYRLHTGLHRTPAEQAGSNLGYLVNGGINVLLMQKRLILGVLCSSEISGLTKKGKVSLQMPDKLSVFSAASIHWKWRLKKFEAYGEYSIGKLKSSALLTGLRYQLNDFLSGSLQVHGYGTDHRETFSSAYASGSHISNERGVRLQLHAEPGLSVMAKVSVELFWYPSPRHLVNIPSSGYKCCCSLLSAGSDRFHWRIRFVKKIWQETPSIEGPGTSKIIQKQTARADGRLVYQCTNKLRWQTRLVVTLTPEALNLSGYTASQQVRFYHSDWLKYTLQFVVFNTPHWNDRIYLYEPGLYHQFNFPVLSGQGQKLTMVVSLCPLMNLVLEGKVSILSYHDREVLGSGNDAVEGNLKAGTGLQLRYTF